MLLRPLTQVSRCQGAGQARCGGPPEAPVSLTADPGRMGPAFSPTCHTKDVGFSLLCVWGLHFLTRDHGRWQSPMLLAAPGLC